MPQHDSKDTMPWRHTKIICTLGPSTDRPGVLEHLVRSGMDLARINTAHGEATEHARRIAEVRRIADALESPVGILVDLPGPKFRVGRIPGGSRELRAGQEIVLGSGAEGGSHIPMDAPALLKELKAGESVYLADGSIKVLVQSVSSQAITCQVIVGGTIRSGSGVNFPEAHLSVELPTEADLRHISFAMDQRAEWIGVSFVRTAADITRVRAHLKPGQPPLVMAKIEKRQALTHLEAILNASDGVMVARGDLGVETDLAEVPLVQKRIVSLANEQGRPVIVATQMLESMVGHPQPTRAEVTDVANAVLDGTDGVMLSAETAIGEFPQEAVTMLHRTVTATEHAYPYGSLLERLQPGVSALSDDAMSAVACRLSFDLHAKAIVAPARDLSAALRLARFRPKAPILVLTDSRLLWTQLTAIWGVIPLLSPTISEVEPCLERAKEWLLTRELAKAGDRMVVLFTSGESRGVSDSLQIIHIRQTR